MKNLERAGGCHADQLCVMRSWEEFVLRDAVVELILSDTLEKGCNLDICPRGFTSKDSGRIQASEI